MSQFIITALTVVWLACGCGGTIAETRFYQLASPAAAQRGGTSVVALDTLSTDAGYDDERIVYRSTPYRVDYYQYHHWTSVPGVMIANYLEHALEGSGKIRAVRRELTTDAPVILGGRVIAIEEVDRSKTEWHGRIVLELQLTDARSGDVLWTEQVEETEPLREQTPEGLAAALSVAMSRIVSHTVPAIADVADRQAQIHAERAAPATAARAPSAR